ncbi:DUF2975 domain-containing protein [Cryobacterium psychrophilum]|uniref:DUF2975 domain-containing protein n=1 Tax=Cryobacterium psychrophilum TaxID=41988 RepID=A0A4Y8KTG5_9MICO|nr:DUF2975 domain-containing protein [Cryobacterium psychrophilum]TDW28708.1 hypothetical protein EDD25_0338 [Cryobacterium psychrophilum]TFD82369.1 DUF2975 domain-containing protein [Cryobacterium psychrophilum]
MRRGISFTLTAALLAVLLVSVFTQLWLLPHAAASVVAVFPEVEPLQVPSVIWGVAAIACWQAVAGIALRVVVLVRDDRFDASADGWLRAMLGCLLAFIGLAVFAIIALNMMGYTTPGVMYGVIAGGLMALIMAVPLVLFLWTRPTSRHYSHN